MNNKILLSVNTVFSLLIITFLAANYFTAEEKLAYVDSGKLLENYQGMKNAKEAYSKNLTVWQANIDTLSIEVQESLKKFEKERASMTEKELALSKELLRSKQQKLVDYQKAIQEKARQEDARLTQDVVVTINAYLKKYGEENKYNIIFGATELGNIVYADNAIDITEKVLTGLNAQYTGK
jgi:outer membrane protein